MSTKATAKKLGGSVEVEPEITLSAHTHSAVRSAASNRLATTRIMVVVLMALYVLVWLASPSVSDRTTSDLDVFFWPAATMAAHGNPLHIYSLHNSVQGFNDNGPLGLLPLIPLVWLAGVAGSAASLITHAALGGAATAVFALLLSAVAVHIIGLARGAVEWRLAAFAVFLVPPALWISVGDYGHTEQPILLLLILFATLLLTRQRWALAGLTLGLAALTRSTALLYMIPLAMVLLATRRAKAALGIVTVAIGATAAGLAPFLIADGPDVLHSLVTYRGTLPIGAGSFWVVGWNATWSGVAQHGDVFLIVGTATVLTAVILWKRPLTATTSAGVFGLLAIAAACFPMLAKATYPYYLLEPYTFAALWWLARPGSALNWRFAVPLLLTADVFISKQASSLPFNGLGLGEGIASSAVLAVTIALVAVDLFRTRVAEPAFSLGPAPTASLLAHRAQSETATA